MRKLIASVFFVCGFVMFVGCSSDDSSGGGSSGSSGSNGSSGAAGSGSSGSAGSAGSSSNASCDTACAFQSANNCAEGAVCAQACPGAGLSQACLACASSKCIEQCQTECQGGQGGSAGSAGAAGSGGSGGDAGSAGTTSGKADGSPCDGFDKGSDCSGGQCWAPDSISNGYCTRSCTTFADCPSFWSCEQNPLGTGLACKQP
ncbi:MAG: hypothetical protein U0165_01560 [Polyangiaceae bacterium]